MNREAVPLIVGLSVPGLLMVIVLLHLYGYDVTVFFRDLDVMYYIAIIPIALGLLVALMHWKEQK